MGQRVDSHVGQRVDSRVGQRVLRTALKRYSARTFYIWNKNGLVPRVDAEYHGFAFFRGFVTTPCCTFLGVIAPNPSTLNQWPVQTSFIFWGFYVCQFYVCQC